MGYCSGVGYRANTFHHAVEMSRGVLCLGVRTEAYPVRLPDGRTVEGRTWGWRERACPFTDEERNEDVIRARGLERVEMIGQSRVTLFKLQDCFDILAEIFDAGKDGFPPCSSCAIRPRQVERTVASDWDAASQCLKADSPAHHY
jgi:hypothetical protein